MSRSKRSAPISGVTAAESEKQWKRHANRKLRRATTQAVQKMPAADPDAVVLPVMEEVADEYGSPKEGKLYFDSRESQRRMRK